MPEEISWARLPKVYYLNNVDPVEINMLWRRMYSRYTTANNYQVVESNYTGVIGLYRVYMHANQLDICGVTNPRGYYPAAWLTPDTNYNGWYDNVMSVIYPNINNQGIKMVMRVYIYPVAGTVYGVNTYNRFYDIETGNQIDSQFNTGNQLFSNSTSQDISYMNIPGTFAAYASINGIPCRGVTTMMASDSLNKECACDLFAFDMNAFSAEMKRLNPTYDFETFEYEDEEYSPEAGPASGAGGYGGFGGDITASDSYGMDPVPTASAAALGFINIYNPSSGGLTSLGEEIFPDFDFNSVVDPTGNDVVDAILNACGAFVDIFNQIPKMFEIFINSRLIDYVQDCHIVPVAPSTGASEHIKLGFRELDTTAPKVTSEYVVEDLGSVDLTEFYHTFIDYQPFTRAKLYLPFLGFVPLEPEYWQNGSISVKYKFNVYDGSFTANVIATPDHSKISQMVDTVIAQYAGTAIVHLPLTGLNYSSMVAGLVGGAGAMANAISGGNIAAAATAALNTAASSPQVMSSNSYTASASFLGQRKPFILIERSVSHFPKKYSHDVGFPSKITVNLGAASGFTTIGDIDLSSVDATDREKDEIRSLLSSGIYV